MSMKKCWYSPDNATGLLRRLSGIATPDGRVWFLGWKNVANGAVFEDRTERFCVSHRRTWPVAGYVYRDDEPTGTEVLTFEYQWAAVNAAHRRRLWETGYRVANIFGQPPEEPSGVYWGQIGMYCISVVRWGQGRIEAVSTTATTPELVAAAVAGDFDAVFAWEYCDRREVVEYTTIAEVVPA